MARGSGFIGALARAHAKSVREANARQRAQAAQVRRIEQARAAAAQADAAEHRAIEAKIKAAAAADARSAKAREQAAKVAERQRIRRAKDVEQQAHLNAQEKAEEQTMEVVDTVEELQGILAASLTVDDCIDFDSLRIHDAPPPLNLPKLVLPTFVPDASIKDPIQPQPLSVMLSTIVRPMTFFERLFRLTKRIDSETAEVTQRHATYVANYEHELDLVSRRKQQHRESHEAECARLREEHQRAVALAESKHNAALQACEAKRKQRDAEVSELEDGYRRGDLGSIELYNEMVLTRSDYPAGFPQEFRLAYQPESRQLVIDFELPPPSIVPPIAEYRYVKARKAIDEKLRKPAEVKAIYREVVAQTTLRTLHEVFEADQGNHIDVVVFSGYINKIDEATGIDTRPYLVSVRATKESFLQINLQRVEPQVCLKNLGAQVSPSPDEARPVKPVVEFDMVDRRFIGESDMLGTLDARPNLMDLTPAEFEALVSNLFTQMGLDTKLTRSSRDGGVDAVAFDTRPILGGKVVIQAKRYRHTVGVAAIRDLYGTMMNEGATKGIIVTTSGYGPDAFGFANDKPLELIDGGGLLYLLESIGRPARIIMPTEN